MMKRKIFDNLLRLIIVSLIALFFAWRGYVSGFQSGIEVSKVIDDRPSSQNCNLVGESPDMCITDLMYGPDWLQY